MQCDILCRLCQSWVISTGPYRPRARAYVCTTPESIGLSGGTHRSPSLSKSKSEVSGQSGHCSARLLAALRADIVAKVPNGPALIFLLQKNPTDDRGSMWPQSRYRGRQRVYLHAMRSPTSLHENRVYSQKKF